MKALSKSKEITFVNVESKVIVLFLWSAYCFGGRGGRGGGEGVFVTL
jgi:hypothetical protein